MHFAYLVEGNRTVAESPTQARKNCGNNPKTIIRLDMPYYKGHLYNGYYPPQSGVKLLIPNIFPRHMEVREAYYAPFDEKLLLTDNQQVIWRGYLEQLAQNVSNPNFSNGENEINACFQRYHATLNQERQNFILPYHLVKVGERALNSMLKVRNIIWLKH